MDNSKSIKMYKFNTKYFLSLPNKIRYLENCIKNKVILRFVYIFSIMDNEIEKIKIMKRFYYLFNKEVWDYISETIKDEKVFIYFAHKVNWRKLTIRVIESLNSKNEDDKIFSDEFIGENLAKLNQKELLANCRFNNIFIKKYRENLNLDLVALYQNVTKITIRNLNLNPLMILKNQYIKNIEIDYFPNMNWEKFFSSFIGLNIEYLIKLSPVLNKNPKFFELILNNKNNSDELKKLLKEDLNIIEKTLNIKLINNYN